MKNILLKISLFLVVGLMHNALYASEVIQNETIVEIDIVDAQFEFIYYHDWIVLVDMHGKIEVIDDGCYGTVLTYQEDSDGNWIPVGATSPCGQCNC